jgi:hypothetical protein
MSVRESLLPRPGFGGPGLGAQAPPAGQAQPAAAQAAAAPSSYVLPSFVPVDHDLSYELRML